MWPVPYLGVCHALRPPQTRCLLEAWIWFALPAPFRAEMLCLLFGDDTIIRMLSQCCRKLRMVSYIDCASCWQKRYFRTGYELYMQSRTNDSGPSSWNPETVHRLQICKTCDQRRAPATSSYQQDPFVCQQQPNVEHSAEELDPFASQPLPYQDQDVGSPASRASQSSSRSRSPRRLGFRVSLLAEFNERPGRWWSPVSDSS